MMPPGTLADFSGCSGKPVQTKVISGSMSLKASGCITEELAKGALAATFGFSEAEKSLIETLVTCEERRRLSSDDNDRRLASHLSKESKISYTVYVPKDVEHTALESKIAQINSGGAGQEAFVTHLQTEGKLEVDKATISAPAPTVENVVVTVKGDGSLAEKPVPVSSVVVSEAASAPSPASEEDSNTGAIVGGIVGGIVALAIIGGIAYYFLVMKKKGEQ